MLNFLKKKKSTDMSIYSPADGVCSDITTCSDPVFANKMIGDGFLVQSTSNIVKSVCNGKVTLVFPTKHAIGITMDNGQEIMIHIGIDTVKLKGVGFKQLVNVNDRINVGDPLIELDLDYLKKQDLDLSIIVIMLNDLEIAYNKEHLNEVVEAQTKIIKRE